MAGTANKTRFYSLALGREKNFHARTDGLITDADTTPSVNLYSLLYANSANTISYFDDGVEGQLVKVINLVNEPVIFAGTQMLAAGSGPLWQNDTITFINHNSSWHEESRSVAPIEFAVAAEYDSTPTVKGVKVLVIDNDAAMTVTGFDDGVEGQLLTVLCHGSAWTLDTSATIINVGSAGPYVVLSNDGIDLAYYDGKWRTRTYAQTP